MDKYSWGVAWAFGAAYSLVTITGVIQGWEHQVALACVIFVGVLIGISHRSSSAVSTAFWIGLFAATFAVFMQGVFFDTYISNNSGYDDVPIPFGLTAKTFTLIFSPLGGLLCGSMTALVAWPVSAIFGAVMPAEDVQQQDLLK